MYRHFSSMDELFEAAVSAPLEEAVTALLGASGGPPEEFDTSGVGMRERTRLFMVDLVRAMEQISEMLGVALFRETSLASAYYRERIAPNLATIESVVQANLEHWNHSDFDPRLAVNLAFGSAWFHVTTAKFEGRPIDAERFAERLVDVMFDGLFRGAGPILD